ncbi:MAG TPA: BadF/BadG/BcrA/BcrD ATPase family protein, partial [Deltaproteobacteria bacterium]|nr:BadF/BadG/BcrA/BcrD ATPase family protein [Deltaproteobacteria bacterium]
MMKSTIVGIDVGSVSIGLAEIDGEGAIVRTGYRIHRGQVRETLFRMLSERDSDSEFFIAVTKSTPSCVRSAQRVDNQVAIIAAARRLHEQVRAVLNVGAEKFSLILFDEQGNYRSSRTNTSCAAGTGSFLDQQAVRLNLKNAGELSRIARRNSGQVPRIASRCAVFAKTDLIHAQQEGYSLEEICDGLCRGLAKNVVDTLFSGVETIEKVIFCGGVSKNRAVGMHISALTGSEIVVDDCSEVYGALGAAI